MDGLLDKNRIKFRGPGEYVYPACIIDGQPLPGPRARRYGEMHLLANVETKRTESISLLSFELSLKVSISLNAFGFSQFAMASVCFSFWPIWCMHPRDTGVVAQFIAWYNGMNPAQ